MIKVGIVGGTGYTGLELIRLLAKHPQVSLEAISSRSEQGKSVSQLFPNLKDSVDLAFTLPKLDNFANCDVVFFATPNGTAMTMAVELLAKGIKVIDLAADFRLKNAQVWQQWYGMPHACPELLSEAVYGLPEVARKQIAKANIIANPGCYPTAVQLGLLPLLKSELIDVSSIIIDAKSGVSGAGRKANLATAFCEVNESLKAYAVAGHRHQPEITEQLTVMTAKPVDLIFVPHLIPMMRGILATMYVSLVQPMDLKEVHGLYQQHFQNEAFVDVLNLGFTPETRSVLGSNMCRIAVYQPTPNKLIVLSVIDNLVKGAAGQAIQNMNLLFDCSETLGLDNIAIMP